MNKLPLVVAVIPARGGSKGIPRKNLVPLAGKPLLVYAIEVGFQAELVDHVFVSTDDDEIAQVGRKHGAEIIVRPEQLALDATPDYPVFHHALEWIQKEKDLNADIVVNLRPTCPLRSSTDVDTAIKKMIETGCDAVRTITLADHHPYWMGRLEGDRLLPFIKGNDIKKYYQRQLLPEAYIINGGVDVMKARIILENKELYGSDVRGVFMPLERSIDIDSEFDLRIAELLLSQEARQ